MSMLVSRFLFLVIFGTESRCLGLGNKHWAKGVLKNTTFRKNRISHDSPVNFSWVVLGPIFMSFVALETSLKFDDFSR